MGIQSFCSCARRFAICAIFVLCTVEGFAAPTPSVKAPAFEYNSSTTSSSGYGDLTDPYSFLWNDSGTEKVRIIDDTGNYVISEFSTITDHGGLTGLADDDHSAGANAYLTTGRHDSEHDAAYNDALVITADVEGNAVLSDHMDDANIHWRRPAQTLTVAKNGTGEYATIAAALTVANANATSTAWYEVLVYGGQYQESNLTVGDFVSLRGVAYPGATLVYDTTANPIVILESYNVLEDIRLRQLGTGDTVDFTSGIGFVEFHSVDFDCDTGTILDYNGSQQNLIMFGCTFYPGAGHVLDNKTAAAYVRAYNCVFDYNSATAVATLFDIDESSSITPDAFVACDFYCDGITGGASTMDVIDWDAETAMFRNCYFRLKANTGQTMRGIEARAGTVELISCFFEWTDTAGTEICWNTESGATVNFSSTVHETADIGPGGGTNAASRIGATATEDLNVSGCLYVEGDCSALVELSSYADGASQDMIAVTPQDTIGATAWTVLAADLDALDPTGAADIRGVEFDATGVSMTNNPDIYGAYYVLPATYGTGTEVAGYFSGDDNSVSLALDNLGAEIKGKGATLLQMTAQLGRATGTSYIDIYQEPANALGDATDSWTGIKQDWKNLDPVDTSIVTGISIVGGGLDLSSGANFRGLSVEMPTTYGVGSVEQAGLFTGDARTVQICTDSAALKVNGLLDMTTALSTATSLEIGGANGGYIYSDGVGCMIQAKGGNPGVILSESGGSTSYEILDSSLATMFGLNSNGYGYIHGGLGIAHTTPSAQLEIGRATGGELSLLRTDTTIVADELLGRLYGRGTNTSEGDGAGIEFRADGAWGTGDRPGKIEFRTVADGAATLVLHMWIGEDGGIHAPGMKSGLNQTAAGAVAGELWWLTSTNHVMMGI